MKLISTMAIGALLIGSAVASDAANKPSKPYSGGKSWTINVGLNLPQGNHKDAGFNTMWTVGADMNLGMAGEGSNATTSVGILYTFGDGDGSNKSRTYGLHYGMSFGLGDPGSMNGLGLMVRLGYYNTRLESGSASEDKWGLGGSAGFVWKPSSMGSQKWHLEFGYYMYPEVVGVDNNGWQILFGFPVGG